jgi:ABC-2 type transport system permease protein
MALQAAIAIFVATQAPQTVSLDLRFHTLPLYLSRPVDRADYVRAKFAAFTTALFLVIAVPVLVLYIGALLAGFDVGENTANAAAAIVGAALFALVLSGIGLLIASLTPRRGFGIAAIITTLVLSYTIVTSLQGMIGYEADDLETAGWIGLFSPTTLVDGLQVWAFGAEPSTPAGPQGNGAGMTFLAVTLIVIVGCYGALLRRYRKVRL